MKGDKHRRIHRVMILGECEVPKQKTAILGKAAFDGKGLECSTN